MARPVNKLPPIHPGELLREDMDALGLSAGALAMPSQSRTTASRPSCVESVPSLRIPPCGWPSTSVPAPMYG